MKGAILAAAALFGSAVTASLHGRHAHEHLHGGLKRGMDMEAPPADNATCGCTTYVTTITGQGVLALPTTTVTSTSTNLISVYATPTAAPLPTPFVTTCPTAGVYTFPATTITISEETTVCGAAITTLAPGNDVYGGVTTIVETATTVVCPYATVSPVGGTVTSIIETTTYVCPSKGTYTIAPLTTSVSQSTVIVYPTPVSYPPGTYTFPATVVTVTETDFVYICPFTSSSAAPPAPTSAPPAAAAPAPAPSSAAAAAPAPSSSSSSSSGGVISGTGDKWCMTYSPYTAGGQCKDAGAVEADISVIASKGFGSVRIYSTDCSGLENVGSSCRAHGLKLVLGIFISETGIDGSRSQLTAIQSWAQYDLVTLVVVGNECIFNQRCTAGALASYISEVKGALSSSGYSGPVTTTEPVSTLQEYGAQLCGAVDIMGANSHPFFNSGTSCDQAGTFLQGQIDIVKGICSGKEVFILETGWPHAGDANGAAVPGPSEQATAIKGIVEVAGKNAAIFSFEDDMWKDPGAFGVERSWGCADQFA